MNPNDISAASTFIRNFNSIVASPCVAGLRGETWGQAVQRRCDQGAVTDSPDLRCDEGRMPSKNVAALHLCKREILILTCRYA